MSTTTYWDDEYMKRISSKELINYYEYKYPGLKGNQNYRMLFLHSLYSTFVDVETNKTLIPYNILCYMNDVDPKDKNFNSTKFLENYKNDVVSKFEWSESRNSKCRSIIYNGLDNDDMKRNFDELKNNLSIKDKYYFVNEKKVNKITLSETRKEDIKEYHNRLVIAERSMNETQLQILKIISKTGLNAAIYTKLYEKNKQLIIDTINNLQPKLDDKISIEEKKIQQLKIIHSIEEDSRIFYLPTPMMRTPRLHAFGECAISLNSSVRKAFCHGLFECDLVSSQFIIISNLLNATLAKKLINSKMNLWTYLNNGIIPEKNIKSVLKTFIYSLCFGETISHMKKNLSLINREDLLEFPMIKELLDKRRELFAKIKKEGGMVDIWLKKQELYHEGRKENIYGEFQLCKERWEGSILGSIIQSIEMEIILGVIKYIGSQSTKAAIILFQHDGFTLHINKAEIETIQNGINKALRLSTKRVSNMLDNIDLTDMKMEIIKI